MLHLFQESQLLVNINLYVERHSFSAVDTAAYTWDRQLCSQGRRRYCVIPEAASGGGLVHSGGLCLGVEEDAFLLLKLARIFHESRNAVTGDAASTHLFQITVLFSFSARVKH